MGSKAQGKKSSEWAKMMRERGIYHGKRLAKGLSNVPADAAGSAAYRRKKGFGK